VLGLSQDGYHLTGVHLTGGIYLNFHFYVTVQKTKHIFWLKLPIL